MSEAQFQAMRDEGAFALDWQANGLRYGIQYRSTVGLPLAGRCWSMDRVAIWQLPVVAIPICWQWAWWYRPTPCERVCLPGAESLEAIEQRLARNASLQAYDAEVQVLDNSTSLANACRALLRLLEEQGVGRSSVQKSPTCKLPD